MATMPWQTMASANTMAVQLRYLPVRIPAASSPRPSIIRLRAMENENSPAIVDLRLPP